VLDGSQLPPVNGTQQPPPIFGPCLLWPWSPISATAELLYVSGAALAHVVLEKRPLNGCVCMTLSACIYVVFSVLICLISICCCLHDGAVVHCRYFSFVCLLINVLQIVLDPAIVSSEILCDCWDFDRPDAVCDIHFQPDVEIVKK